MRYLYAVASFVLLVSLLFLAHLFLPARMPQKAIALKINNRVITKDELSHKLRTASEVKDPFSPRQEGDLIQSLITKELLIQESQRLGIDREESFRQSVQNFYEQSLIKILMERKYASLPAETNAAEIARYQQLAGRRLHLAVSSFPDRQRAATAPGSEKTSMAFFHDLANELKAALLAVEIGKPTAPLPVGDHYAVYRIAEVEEDPELSSMTLAAEQVSNRIIQYKREKALSDWLAGLREGAAVEIFSNGAGQ